MRTALIGLVLLFAVGQAQIHIGLGAAFASQMEHGGLSIRGGFEMFKTKYGKTIVMPNFTSYTRSNDLSRMEMNLDFHNVIGEPDIVMGYLIAGLRYDLDINSASTQVVTTGDFGVNIGMGIQYMVSEDIKFFIEGKYLGLSELNRFQLGTGFSLALGKNK